MNNLYDLEQLVIAAEQAGANLAPTYQEYMPLAFAIANSCGEPGRILFHRLCRLSEKYRQEDAEKLYDHALRGGHNGNSLGTVFHLAEQAGVVIDKKPANRQTPAELHTPTPACAYKHTHEAGGTPEATSPVGLPCFPRYSWPLFLQRAVDCGDSPAQRDILLLGAVTVFGATLNKLLSVYYGQKERHPCLQAFIVAPPASGKGALTWVRRLAEPLHDKLMEEYYTKLKAYRQEKTRWDMLGKERARIPEPEAPCMKMFLIAGDNSGSGMLENLIDADGAGLICETEADTVSSAIGSDYGHWSDTLRKSFDHERLAFNRRTNHEYRECRKSCLSVLLSGTPAQVKPLIPSAENGLFSRQIFYYMPAISEWADQFERSDIDYDQLFTTWGERWKQVLDTFSTTVSSIRMELNDPQKQEFNRHLSQVFSRAGIAHGDHMKSTVARIAINICRIISVVALMRSLDSLPADGNTKPTVQALLQCPGLAPSPRIPQENVQDGIVPQWILTVSNDDFHAVLSLTEPLYQHSCHVLSFLPANDALPAPSKPQESFLDLLPLHFTRNQAIQAGARNGLPPTTVDPLLKRMLDKGQLEKTARGEYEFIAHIRTRMCVCKERVNELPNE